MKVVYKNVKKKASWFGIGIRLAALIFTATALWAFIQPSEKVYSVSLPISRWVQHDRGLEFIKAQLKSTDMPSKVMTFITDSILSPLQDDIAKQVSPVYQSEQKRLQDSASKATKPKQ